MGSKQAIICASFALAFTASVGCTVGDEAVDIDIDDDSIVADEAGEADGDDVDEADGDLSLSAIVPGPTWKMATLVFRNIDADLVDPNGVSRKVRLSMSAARRDQAVATANNMQEKFTLWNGGRADATMAIIEITTSIKHISGSGNSNYWITPGDVKWALDAYAPKGRYDSVFVMWDAGTQGELNYLPGVYAAWGITGAPSDATNGMTYATVHPETGTGGMIHEWLHGAGGFYRSKGLDVPDPHENDPYGFRGPYNGTWTYWYKAILSGKLVKAGIPVGYTSSVYRSGTPRKWLGGSFGAVAMPTLAQPVLQKAYVDGGWVYTQWAPVRRPSHYTMFLMIVNRDGTATQWVYKFAKPGIDRSTFDYQYFHRDDVCAAARRAGTKVDLGAVRMRFQVWPDRTSASAANMSVTGTLNCN